MSIAHSHYHRLPLLFHHFSLPPRHFPSSLSHPHRHLQNPHSTKTRPLPALPSFDYSTASYDHKHPFRCFGSMTTDPSNTSSSSSQLQDSLSFSRAYWVSESLIAWNVGIGDRSCFLYASRSAQLAVTDDGIQGYDVEIKLERSTIRLPEKVTEKFPHIQDYRPYLLPPAVDTKSLLKCQLAVAIYDSNGRCCSATGLQLPGVLDELFAYTGPLGAVFSEEDVSLYLWAPTAQFRPSKHISTTIPQVVIL